MDDVHIHLGSPAPLTALLEFARETGDKGNRPDAPQAQQGRDYYRDYVCVVSGLVVPCLHALPRACPAPGALSAVRSRPESFAARSKTIKPSLVSSCMKRELTRILRSLPADPHTKNIGRRGFPPSAPRTRRESQRSQLTVPPAAPSAGTGQLIGDACCCTLRSRRRGDCTSGLGLCARTGVLNSRVNTAARRE